MKKYVLLAVYFLSLNNISAQEGYYKKTNNEPITSFDTLYAQVFRLIGQEDKSNYQKQKELDEAFKKLSPEILNKESKNDDNNDLGQLKALKIRYGVSLGFNQVFAKLVEARISPIDTTLRYEKTPGTSFVLSTSVSFPITKGKLGGSYYYQVKDGEKVGESYYVPRGLAIIGAINLATFNSALGGSGVFNAKLDGGLGLAYTFADNVQIAGTFEMISYRQPRKYLDQYENKKININGEYLLNIPLDDNDYFANRYMPSISFKVVYLLNNKP